MNSAISYHRLADRRHVQADEFLDLFLPVLCIPSKSCRFYFTVFQFSLAEI